MKYGKLMLFWWIALPVSLLMRLFQLFFTVDRGTGFFLQEQKTVGVGLTVLIGVFCAVSVILAFTSHRRPEHPPKKNLPIAFGALLAAAATGHELVRESFSGTVLRWQLTLLAVAGVAAVAWFAAFGLSQILPLRVPPVLAAIPAFYMVIRIICAFTSISSLALISDNLLLMAAYCTALLFFIQLGKLYNGLEGDSNFRKLLASGLAAILLCLTQSIPHIVINLCTEGYHHTSDAANASVLAYGVLILAFTLSHFSKRNMEAV